MCKADQEKHKFISINCDPNKTMIKKHQHGRTVINLSIARG